MDEQQHAEIISRLDRIEQLGLTTNGRVTKLETWKVQHESEHSNVMAAIRDLPEQVKRAIGEHELTQDARRWRALVGGAKAVGFKGLAAFATVIGSSLAGALLTVLVLR